MEPISIEVSKENKFLCLIGPHRIGIVCPDKNKILLGRGSIGVLNNIQYYHQAQMPTPVLEVGDFCESSACTVLVGGEHDHQSAWNLAYAGLPVLSEMATVSKGIPLAHSKGTTVIESNVILSFGALVISGSKIGSGSVIGANAVVSGTVPPKTLWIGNPGNSKPRFKNQDVEVIYDQIKWDKLPVSDLLGVGQLVLNADSIGLQKYFNEAHLLRNTRLWFDAATKARKIELKNMLGVTINDQFLKPSQFPHDFLEYFKQAQNDEPAVNWVPDAFEQFLR
ncbi:MAG: hypothetical protein Q7U57_01335 [Methylovulum sp.]|nr:hypothetical protein [Methylovulum sp.]